MIGPLWQESMGHKQLKQTIDLRDLDTMTLMWHYSL